jgi:tetratricopeptide (TPR) repeat protein
MAYSSSDSSLLIARCLYEEALLRLRQKIVDTLLVDKIKTRLAQENLPLQEHALLQLALVNNLLTTGAYSEAFSLSLQALEKFKQADDKPFIVKALNHLGNICTFINLNSLAIYYYSEALKNITSENYEYLPIRLNIFFTKFPFNKDETLTDSIRCLLEVAEKEGREELLPIFYLNLGSFFLTTYPEKAIMYFTKIQTLDFDYPELTAVLYANLGLYVLIENDYSNALNYFKDAQKIMEENKSLNHLSFTYDMISTIFEKQNIIDSALFYAKKHKELTRKIHSNTIAVETHQKYVTTILETQKNELIILEQKITLKNKQFTIIVIVSASVVLLILLLLLLFHQQKRRKAGENRELTAKLEHEKKVQQYEKRQQKLEKEKQEMILDAKTREITSYSLLVSNKNHLLKQIMELNVQVLDNKENATEIAIKIDEIIQNNLNIDKEWENFKMHFDKVHPHFFEKLKQLCSNLTEENLKVCAYFKIGMTTKQIAQLLHIVPRSIIISRHRLKKKLQLPDNEDIDDFIRSL